MNGTELESIRRALLLQKGRILNKAVEFRSEEMSGYECTADEADKISKELSLSLSIHLQERDRTSLFQIDKALGKLHDGTYGQCESCHDSININRLRARPFAVLCISCMEEQEELHTPVN